MQAIVFANRQGQELSPLNQEYCPALLPIGNKALVEYTIEDLANAGISQIKLVISTGSHQISQHLGDGSKWGVKLSYFLSGIEEKVEQVLQRLALESDEVLLIRGDILRSPCVKSFIEYASKIPAQFTQANFNEHSAGIQLHQLRAPKHNAKRKLIIHKQARILDWPMMPACPTKSNVTQVLHGDCYRLDNLESYLAANLALAKGNILGLKPNGRSHESYHSLYVERHVELAASDKLNAHGLIGQRSKLASDISLKDSLVIGDNCFISQQCEIRNSVILSNSFIGKRLLLSNCIVSKNLLINLTNNSVSYLNDQQLLGNTRDFSADIAIKNTNEYRGNVFTKLFALFAYLATLPIHIAALLFIALKARLQPGSNKAEKEVVPHSAIYQTIAICTNQGQVIDTKMLNTEQPLIARLPLLKHVIKGELALFGLNPEPATKSPSITHIQADTRMAPLGLLGPVQLLLDKSAPAEEKWLVDTEFAKDMSYLSLSKLLLKTLMPKAQGQNVEAAQTLNTKEINLAAPPSNLVESKLKH